MGHLSTSAQRILKNGTGPDMFLRANNRTTLENLILAAMKQAAPHTCFFFLVFFI